MGLRTGLALCVLFLGTLCCRGSLDADLERVKDFMTARGYHCDMPSPAEVGEWPVEGAGTGGGERGAMGPRGRALWREKGWGSPEDVDAMTVLMDGTVCLRWKEGYEFGSDDTKENQTWLGGRRLAGGVAGKSLTFPSNEGLVGEEALGGEGGQRRKVMQAGSGAFAEEPGLPSTRRGRTRVPLESSTEKPFSAIGQVGRFCSGALVGPCHYLTAGHCVWESEIGMVTSGANFNPGRNGEELPQPLGQFQALQVYPAIKWTLFENSSADVAIVQVQGTPGDELGMFKFTGENLPAAVGLNNAGYPVDKPDGEMWFDFCDAVIPRDGENRGLVIHDCETTSGSSGSALWTYSPGDGEREDERTIVAVHSGRRIGVTEDTNQLLQEPGALHLTGSILRELQNAMEDMVCVPT